jgi:hypothetical protein
MAEDRRIRYLTELDASLPMPLERRAEVIEEINSHLDDAVAAQLERGILPAEAEESAQARVGPPHLLAADLARSEQSTWWLLAGVGAGVRTGLGQGVYGFLLGWLLTLLGIYALLVVVRLSDSLFKTGWNFQFTDQGWNTLITTGAIAFGLYYSGRAVPRAVGIASRRPFAEVRPWVASLGTAAAFLLLVFAVEMPQNWPSVIALSIAPLAFAVGSYRPNLVHRRLHVPWVVLIALLFLIPLGLLASAGGNGGASETSETSVWGEWGEERAAIVGPQWAADGDLELGASGWSSDGRAVTATWELGSPAQVAGLRELRVEAWRADPDVIGGLDARWTEPFAVAGVERDGAALSGTVVTTTEPGISVWELFLTGSGADGRRYVVASGGGGNSTFTGTVWDWAIAVAD